MKLKEIVVRVGYTLLGALLMLCILLIKDEYFTVKEPEEPVAVVEEIPIPTTEEETFDFEAEAEAKLAQLQAEAEQKQTAVNSMIQMTDFAEKEAGAEILLEAKGFSDVVVSISSTGVDVVVNALELTDVQRAQIEDIVTRKTDVTPENIVISTVTE